MASRKKALPATLGELSKTPYSPRSVKDELRENLVAPLKTGQPLFPGIVGYDQTVIPQIVHAVLSKHDMLFLGLRGQAKTRILRALPSLLDEQVPVPADDETAEDKLIGALTGEAVANVFARYQDYHNLEPVVAQFSEGLRLQSGDDVSNAELLANARHVDGLVEAGARVCRKAGCNPKDTAHLASAAEFVLEALYVNNRLSKFTRETKTYYKQ